MANIKSSKKRVLVAERNYERNVAFKSSIKTAIKKAVVAVNSNAADKAECVRLAVKKIDQAESKGILHKNWIV